jgi:hypothetical protein
MRLGSARSAQPRCLCGCVGLGRPLNALLDAGNAFLLQDEGRSCHYTRDVA